MFAMGEYCHLTKIVKAYFGQKITLSGRYKMDDRRLSEMISTYEAETDPSKKIDLIQEVAKYCCNTLRDFKTGLEYQLIVLQMLEDLNEDERATSCLHDIGWIYSKIPDIQKAEEYYHKALIRAEASQNEPLLAVIFIRMGIFYGFQGNYPVSLEYLGKALKIGESLNQPKIIGLAIANIGATYISIQEYEKALQTCRQSLNLIPPDSQFRITVYRNISAAYKHLKQYPLAIGYLKKSLPLFQRYNLLDDMAVDICDIGTIYVSMDKIDKAIEYLHKAKDFISKNPVNPVKVNPILSYLIMEISVKKEDFTDGFADVEQYIQSFNEIGTTDQFALYNFYRIVYNYYEKQKKFDLAYEYIKKYIEINQKILDDEMKRNMAIKTANFEYERQKHKAELADQKAELLKQKNDELLSYQKIIEQKNDDLILLHEEKDNLMNTISHDLKNYLGATQQAIDIFALKGKTLADNKYLKIVATSTARSLNLVKDILYSTKITTSKDTLSLKTLDINQIIAGEEDTLQLRGSKKGLNISFSYAQEPLYVQIDSEKWHRVFENLTTNAIKFTPTGKQISISTSRQDDFICVSIEDSGIGIPAENIEKLFTPFSGVGRKGTEGEESTGLGLSIVKKIVELHGGEIEVFSEVGKGTLFVVKLLGVRD